MDNKHESNNYDEYNNEMLTKNTVSLMFHADIDGSLKDFGLIAVFVTNSPHNHRPIVGQSRE
jgi:hypothetical protein